MQNALRRLTRYRSGDITQKENQATETLATCLQLSTSFRRDFLTFLYRDNEARLPKSFSDPDSVEVSTQLSIEGSGTLDLLLERHTCRVVVEVKVAAKERDAHHKDQLDRYALWLSQFPESALFTLVRDPDPAFNHPGVLKRWSWSELHDMARQFVTSCGNPTDKVLIGAFCEYLTLEDIVHNMDYTKLVDYGKGWAAEEALEGLYSRTTELLSLTATDLLEPRNHDPKGSSPSFQFGRSSWEKIFGQTGWNNKAYAYFCTPATEPDLKERCEFRFEILLWHKDHGHDWKYTSTRLPKWFQHLHHKDCPRGAYSRRGSWLEWKEGQALDPANNYAFLPEIVVPNLPVTEDSLKNIHVFASQLAQRITACFKLADGLASLP